MTYRFAYGIAVALAGSAMMIGPVTQATAQPLSLAPVDHGYRAPFDQIIARYLKAIGDPREVVCDPEARYFGGRVEEHSLVPLSEARLGQIGLEEWVRRSQKGA